MSASDLRVVVIGGGIGGLSLGLALRERGVVAEVFEEAPALTEIGAAIALSANATREYARLGLVDELSAAATIPTEVTPRTRFDDLGIDSLTMVDVVVAVEDRFGLVIPDDEWAHFETVGNVGAHVQWAARLPR